MSIALPLLQELAAEATTTRRVLDRVPEAHLAWQPHPKSMSLGQLALHVAMLPKQLSEFVAEDALDFSAAAGAPPAAASHEALMTAFDESVALARSYLESLSDARAMGTWMLKRGDTPLFSSPRIGVIRSFLFNHWYHHRGQLDRRPSRSRRVRAPRAWSEAPSHP